jgi:hypothetical protein
MVSAAGAQHGTISTNKIRETKILIVNVDAMGLRVGSMFV